MKDEFLWVEKYRPKTLDDCVLSNELRSQFNDFVARGDMPNLLLSGTAGTGKTTVAKALCEELGYTVLMINGSLEGRNIDTLRNEITGFSATMSFDGSRKCVILDEADYLNQLSFQPALRGFIEQFSNVRFILTCNYKDKIIEPIHSRTTLIDFRISKQEIPALMSKFMKRVLSLLSTEDVKVESKQVIASLIQKHFPDMRRTLNELQRYSASGVIDKGILVNISDARIEQVIGHLRDKNFGLMRQWVCDNLDTDPSRIFRMIYDNMTKYIAPASIPALVLLIADYQYKQAFVQDQEINLVAFLTETMAEMEFK